MAKITLRKDGRYETRITYAAGKRKTIYGYTKKEVEDKALEFQLKIKQGIDPIAARDSFEQWANRWIKLKGYEVSASRLSTCKTHLKHLEPLYPVPIEDIQTIDIQEIILQLAQENPTTEKPTSQNTLQNINNTAKQIFSLCIESMVLVRNPADFVKIPDKTPTKKRRALTEEEQEWIQKMPHRAQTPAMIMLYAGLRRGEVLALTWSDINFKTKMITVNKSAERIKTKFEVKPSAKTQAGNRTVTMPKVLVDYLRKQPKSSFMVTTNAKNQIHTPSSWKRMWESYLFEINWEFGKFNPLSPKPEHKNDPSGVPVVIDNLTPHMLRHSYATILYFAGVDALTAKSLLGHEDIQTTLNIYTHLDENHVQKNIVKLDKYLNKEKKSKSKKA